MPSDLMLIPPNAPFQLGRVFEMQVAACCDHLPLSVVWHDVLNICTLLCGQRSHRQLL